MFFDENWIDEWPLESNAPARDLYKGGMPFGKGLESQMARCTIDRHGGVSAAKAPSSVSAGTPLPGAINMGFADGHVQLTKLENLWNCSWHVNWVQPATRPP